MMIELKKSSQKKFTRQEIGLPHDSFVFTLVTAKLYPLKNMPISFVDLKTFREGILMFLSATSTHTSKFVVRKKIFVEF